MNLIIDTRCLFSIYTDDDDIVRVAPRMGIENFMRHAFSTFHKVYFCSNLDRVSLDIIKSVYLYPMLERVQEILGKTCKIDHTFVQSDNTYDQIRMLHAIMKSRRYPNISVHNVVYLTTDIKLSANHPKNNWYIPRFSLSCRDDRTLDLLCREMRHLLRWFSTDHTVRTYPSFLTWIDRYINQSSIPITEMHNIPLTSFTPSPLSESKYIISEDGEYMVTQSENTSGNESESEMDIDDSLHSRKLSTSF